VKKGLPFRDAHAVIGNMVFYCIEHNKAIDDLTMDEMKSFSDIIEEDIYEAVSLRTCVEKRLTLGAPGSEMMKKVIEQEKEWLAGWHSRIDL
jgi:argininosuccinate lyase